MKNLPFWHLTNKNPAFYDADSKTVVEMVARVYGAVDELITESNKFQEDINKILENHELTIDEFKKCITELIENYIKMIDDKILLQDAKIDDAIENAIAEGKIKAVGTYDETTESLDIVITYDRGEE